MKIEFKYMLIIKGLPNRELAHLPLIDELRGICKSKTITMQSSINEYIFCIESRSSIDLKKLIATVKDFDVIAKEATSVVLLSLGCGLVYVMTVKSNSLFKVKDNATLSIGMIKGMLSDINTYENVPKFLSKFKSNYSSITIKDYTDASGLDGLNAVLMGYSSDDLFLVKPRFILSSLIFFI